jgi:lysyl-tRNA synthetase class 1
MSLSDVWLVNALAKTIEVYNVMPGHFAGWVARSGLFDDLTLVMEGVIAWYGQDFVKCVHVLVPQIEKGLRGIVSKLGKPVTKRHPTVAGVSVAISMGDILYADDIRAALGPELTLHFLTLYSDPRGLNLRNEVAHGLIGPNEFRPELASMVIHTLLIFGIWEPLSKAHWDEPKTGAGPVPPNSEGEI